MLKNEITVKGKLFAVEGADAVGKTQFVEMLATYISKKFPNDTVHSCSETGEEGIFTRGISNPYFEFFISSIKTYDNHDFTIMHNLMACRNELFYNSHLPNLQKGKAVICDRFYHSMYVFQNGMRKTPLEVVDYFHKLTYKDFKPDYTFIIIASTDLLKRNLATKNSAYGYDDATFEFHQAVQDYYLNHLPLELDRPNRRIYFHIDKIFTYEDVENFLNANLM